jgi:hypothetical protein
MITENSTLNLKFTVGIFWQFGNVETFNLDFAPGKIVVEP